MTAPLHRVSEDAFTALVEAGHAPGVAYGVLVDGALVHTGSVGLSDDAGPAIFRIASMTKSFVAATVLLLRDHGLLHLDADVADLVPQVNDLRLPTRDSMRPTVRHLLTMSAGFVTDDPWADRLESLDPGGLDAQLRRGYRMVRAAGSGFEYSNLGYALLGRVITATTGTSFREVITHELLRPLGLSDTRFAVDELDAARVVIGHSRTGDAWRPEAVSGPGEFSAIGGLFSTVPDLARWIGHLIDAVPARDDEDPGPLCRSTRREMQRLQVLTDVSATLVDGGLRAAAEGYGFGLFVDRRTGVGDVVRHSGGYPGFGSHMVWHPVRRVGVVGLANGRYAPVRQACATVLDALLADCSDSGPLPGRPWPETVTAAARLDGIVDTLAVTGELDGVPADAVLGACADLDEPRAHRRARIAAALDETGPLGPARVLDEQPARRTWLRPGARADLRQVVTLDPQEPPRVQRWDVTVVAHQDPELLAAAHAVLDALDRNAPAPGGVDAGEYALVRALGGRLTLEAADRSAATADGRTPVVLRGPDIALGVERDTDGVVHLRPRPVSARVAS